ncbi:hypothetical protein DLNHIDIE_02998 [Acidithiobacillus thiooxidans ATCC 19377]|uniref:Uncharacterized protein n=1 Tax=Acidithiobacillus thiooxidans ATCC 19377 TaxID=637390 RepID=A0A543PZU2_ACITH|nr:hypothetical protein DLNHIDIE_02998 [Acidithiobacillus thiooxidans ATCC 19377]
MQMVDAMPFWGEYEEIEIGGFGAASGRNRCKRLCGPVGKAGVE